MSADKGYFIVVDGSEEQHRLAVVVLKTVRPELTNGLHRFRRAKYLVVRPHRNFLQWGDSKLQEHRQDPSMVELFLTVENV